MKEYYFLKTELKKQELIMHNELKKEGKSLFLFVDIIFIMFLLSNIGAVTLTNMMVAKAMPDLIIKEVNPIQAKIQNIEEHPQSLSLYLSFLIQVCLYFIFIISYIMVRGNVFLRWHLLFFVGFFSSVCFIGLLDFFNDFGYWFGMI